MQITWEERAWAGPRFITLSEKQCRVRTMSSDLAT